ncbi:MAG: ImmA/IrrE family metallo-endopeptidase [Candidatus Desulforudis sp.]|nr:ImmA/IrrE family metallo-endopeptidase [Desulforudis sp.]
MIGERIKLARGAAGLSLRALADQVGVSAQAISKYERGLDIPSSGVLLRLAQALGVELEYFFRTRTLKIQTPAFRKRSRLPAAGRKRVMGLAQEWIERHLDVEDLFPDRASALPSSALWEIRKPIGSLEEVEEQADHLRRIWNIGTDPIENLTELLEDRGVRVGLIDAQPGFDACLFETEDGQPVIVVNRNLPGDRQRFSLGHELGHAVLALEEVDAEKAANRFAGAFLVPAETARRELGNRRRTLSVYELGLLKQKYGLSMQAWIYRAMDLKILSQAAAANLFKHFRKQGWHLSEPGKPIPREQPRLLERLVLRALAEDVVSESRAAELLGKPLSHLYQEVAAEHGDVPPDPRN